MSYRIRHYGRRWVVLDERNYVVTHRYHRRWISAFYELLRLRGWL